MNAPICPMCKGFIPNNETPGAYSGAISRRDNKTEICSACGTREALADFVKSNPVMYVTADGTFGDARQMQTFNVARWTDEMHEVFDEASDNERLDLARHFDNDDNHKFEVMMRHINNDSSQPRIPINVCEVCDLTPSQLFVDAEKN